MRIVYTVTEAPEKPRRRLSLEARQELVRRLRAGAAMQALAIEFGVDRSTVRRLRDRDVRRSGTGTTGGEVLTTRVAATEAQALDALIAWRGYRSRSEGLRAMIRAGLGFLEFSAEENGQLDELTRALNKVGVNVNQMARLANSGRLQMSGKTLADLQELRQSVEQLRAYLVQMTAERRRTGIGHFAGAMEGRGAEGG